MSIYPIRLLFTAFAVCAFLLPGRASADVLSSTETPVVESPEMVMLRQRIETLESKVQSSRESLNAFNPSITAFGNVMGCFSWPKKTVPAADAHGHDHAHEGKHDHDHGHKHKAHAREAHDHGSECSNQIWLREVELDFRAAIDPYADAVLILGFEQESPGTFAVEIEEAYAVLKPGFQLKVGRFLSSFGRINRIHTHDLPWMTSPNAAAKFLGGHGFKQDGASGEIILPSPSESSALTLNLEILFGSQLPMADAETKLPKFVGRLSWFFDLGKGHDLDLGASALVQPVASAQPFQLYGADFNYRWRPFEMGDRKSVLFGGEFFAINGSSTTNFDKAPLGGFLWTQYQFNQNAYIGVRYSYDQGVSADEALNTAAGVFMTYYTTEFLRFRAGYERVSNNIAFKDGADLFMIEMNFIFGSHPTEPYWVNR